MADILERIEMPITIIAICKFSLVAFFYNSWIYWLGQLK
jgi:hypothetical protein